MLALEEKTEERNNRKLKIQSEAGTRLKVYSSGCSYSSSGAAGACCQTSSNLSGT